MDVEEFKQKYEELKDNPMYKNFCSILDTKNQVLERMSKENQQLKEQLERSEKARLKCLNKIKTLGKFDGENFTRSFTLWSADFNELISILDIDKGE